MRRPTSCSNPSTRRSAARRAGSPPEDRGRTRGIADLSQRRAPWVALFHRLDFYADLSSPIIEILLRFLDQVASPRGLIKIEGLTTLVFQATLRAIAVALRVGLQVRIIRKRPLWPPLNNRLPLVISDRHTVCYGCD